MGQILESLKRHYADTSQEALDKEWEELAYLNDIGPDVFEYAEEMKEYMKYIEFVDSSSSTVYRRQSHTYSFDPSDDGAIHNESDYDYAA
mgnify:FL=1